MAWRGVLTRLTSDRSAPSPTTRMVQDDRTGEMVELSAADDDYEDATSVLTNELERIERTQGTVAAQTIRDLAYGLTTPLMHYVDAWLIEGGIKGPLRERTKRQYRSDLQAFAAWFQSVGIPSTIEATTKRVAGRYVTEGLLGRGVDRKTASRKISAVSAYWRWLVKRTEATDNPWTGQSVAKVSGGQSTSRLKRPFTEAEVVTLLNGHADPELSDLMRVAALSGMRIEEVYRLTIADCAGEWFNVREAKSRAGVRRVPIHSTLNAIVVRRTTGKAATAYLFPEAGPPREGRERSMAVSKRFGHYRQRLHVDERVDGRRQSAVDFHSWRRWFVTTARNAGFDQATVAAIVGHDVGNLTDDVYSSGPAQDRKRECVEAVRLPRSGPVGLPKVRRHRSRLLHRCHGPDSGPNLRDCERP